MNFEKYVPEANRFLKEVAEAINTNQDMDHAYRVVRAVLHTLREILTVGESAHLIAQLPMFIKAVYVDGWNFQQARHRIRTMDAFLQCLRKKDVTAARDLGNDETAKACTRAVFAVLQRHVSPGEIMDILNQFPGALSELWFAPAEN